MSKKKDNNGFKPMFQGGAFPARLAPWRAADNKNSAEEDAKKSERKENLKSTLKSARTQKSDRKKGAVEAVFRLQDGDAGYVCSFSAG